MTDNKFFILHFLYGSKPMKKIKGEELKVFGELLGGHVYFEFEGFVYGFEPINDKKLHIFPKKNLMVISKKNRFKNGKTLLIIKK